MRIGTSRGPADGPHHQSTHYVYDLRSGAIIGAYHFSGAAARSEEERHASILSTSHHASGIALKDLAVLANPELPPGDGELHFDPAARRLVRRHPEKDRRLRP